MLRALLIPTLAVLALAGCQPGSTSPAPPDPEPGAPDSSETPVAPVAPADAYFPLEIGGQTVDVQLAITGPEMQTGLMNRQSMGEHQGMIFVYPRPRSLSFWMRNTYIPLDIAFINPDGVIEEIYPMQPLDETSVPSRSANIQFALEMNQGWFDAYGVQPGDRINLNQLAGHVEARGFSSEPIRNSE